MPLLEFVYFLVHTRFYGRILKTSPGGSCIVVIRKLVLKNIYICIYVFVFSIFRLATSLCYTVYSHDKAISKQIRFSTKFSGICLKHTIGFQRKSENFYEIICCCVLLFIYMVTFIHMHSERSICVRLLFLFIT